MRALVVLFALTSAACGTLHLHAQVAATTAPVIDAVGAAIESEAYRDVEEVRASGVDVEARIAKLQQSYEPIERAYEEARAAHEGYVKAILAAVERGNRRLGAGYAVRMLEAWRSAESAGERIGVNVPAPPKALVQLAQEVGP